MTLKKIRDFMKKLYKKFKKLKNILYTAEKK